MIGRRQFITLLGGAAAWPLAGTAEARSRIAFLTLSAPQEEAALIAAFRDGLRRLGYVEGRNVDIDYRYAVGAGSVLRAMRYRYSRRSPSDRVGSRAIATTNLARSNHSLVLRALCGGAKTSTFVNLFMI
jgi:hypothetical protein